MHSNRDNEVAFQIEGHSVEIEFKPLSGEHVGSIEEEIRKDRFFDAKIKAIVGGVKTLKHDGKIIIRERTRAEKRSGMSLDDTEGIPDVYDEKTDKDLFQMLIEGVVARNPRLATRNPHKIVFEEYADEDVPKKDPTPLRAATSAES